MNYFNLKLCTWILQLKKYSYCYSYYKIIFASCAVCETGWFRGSTNCYKIVYGPKTYYDAQEDCKRQAEGGHLATVRDMYTNDLINNKS